MCREHPNATAVAHHTFGSAVEAHTAGVSLQSYPSTTSSMTGGEQAHLSKSAGTLAFKLPSSASTTCMVKFLLQSQSLIKKRVSVGLFGPKPGGTPHIHLQAQCKPRWGFSGGYSYMKLARLSLRCGGRLNTVDNYCS